jgi:hypothetical protein
MGILDSIVSPIKSVISDLTVPVKSAERLFGEVINFTEDIIKAIKDMISEMESLFNASKVENLFVSPFKEAALVAVGSIDKLFKLMIDVSEISTDGVKELLIDPIRDAYNFMTSSLGVFRNELGNMVNNIEDDLSSLRLGLYHEFRRIDTLVEQLKQETDVISRKIENEFRVEIRKASGDVYEFGTLAGKESENTFAKVRRTGEATRESFENLESSIKRRLAAESAQVDLLYFVLFAMIFLLIAGVFIITQSIIVIKIIIVALVIFFFVFALTGFISSLFS